ncbi:MAG: response regulator transcription factor [Halieaceae bacterium]|jgi:DNA-binding response OmpR family regulator|nr:response regulator transcription factor [Halieaceae bacterium]
MNHTVLIIDDDQALCELLADFLQLEGFDTRSVHDGAEAIDACKGTEFDAVVLDVMLPRVQGFDVLRRLREFSDVPVIMLTARGEDTDRIVGLEMGADDYMPKPCNPRELAARLRAVLRRTEKSGQAEPTELEVGALRASTTARRMEFEGRELKLTTAEFNVLLVLMRHAGEAVNKEMLSQQALGRALTAYDRSVDVHVSNLRKKLGHGELIKNVRGVGYQLVTAGLAPSA